MSVRLVVLDVEAETTYRDHFAVVCDPHQFFPVHRMEQGAVAEGLDFLDDSIFVGLPKALVVIHSIELLEFANGGDTFKLSIECGGGVYIRSLIRDVGRELGTVANMVALERSKQGVFDLDSCIMMETELGEKLTEATIYDSLIAV